MDELFVERLEAFAKRLNRLKSIDEPNIKDFMIPWLGECVKPFYSVKSNVDVFIELPFVFKEWQIDEFDEPILKYYPDLDLPKSCLKFFGITPVEFTHFFDVEGGYQNLEKFGGKELRPFSPLCDMGYNITEFLKKSKN